MKAEVDIRPFLKAINEFRIAEQQPSGVQVVEWVDLVALYFILRTRIRTFHLMRFVIEVIVGSFFPS